MRSTLAPYSRQHRVIPLLLAAALLVSCGRLSLDPVERLERARESAAAGDLNAAIVDLKALLQAQPEQLEARLLLGEALLRTGDVAGAEKEFGRVVERSEAVSEDSSETAGLEADFERRARIGLSLAQLNLKNFAGAQETLAPLVAAQPDDLTIRQIAAQVAFLAGQNEEARRHLEVVLAGLPDHPGANFMLGVVRMRQGQSAEAERYLDHALSVQPGNNAARFIVAQLKIVLGKPLDALDALIPLLQQTLADVRILQVLDAIDMRDEAVASEVLARSDRLAEESPDSALPSILRGTALLATQRYGEAAEAFRAAAARGGGRYATVGSIVAYGRDANRDAVRQVISEWLESNPEDSTLRAMLATDYIGTGELASAATEYEALLAEQRSNPTLLNNLAWLYGELGDDRAIEFARNAYRLAPQEAAIIDTLGWLLVQSGEYDEGIELLRDAVSRAPGVDAIRTHLVQALAEIGAEDEANRVLAGMAGSAQETAPEQPAPLR